MIHLRVDTGLGGGMARFDEAEVHLLHIVPLEHLMLFPDIYGKAAEKDNVVEAEREARQARTTSR